MGVRCVVYGPVALAICFIAICLTKGSGGEATKQDWVTSPGVYDLNFCAHGKDIRKYKEVEFQKNLKWPDFTNGFNHLSVVDKEKPLEADECKVFMKSAAFFKKRSEISPEVFHI
eukprot:GHVS01107392.1.p1 GENE.GHVS01107392.1~~GHVS01107392.1.p1  ORF type:complete len:115 (+),score=8.98 GHVS01107392.1:121-465(+)